MNWRRVFYSFCKRLMQVDCDNVLIKQGLCQIHFYWRFKDVGQTLSPISGTTNESNVWSGLLDYQDIHLPKKCGTISSNPLCKLSLIFYRRWPPKWRVSSIMRDVFFVIGRVCVPLQTRPPKNVIPPFHIVAAKWRRRVLRRVFFQGQGQVSQ